MFAAARLFVILGFALACPAWSAEPSAGVSSAFTAALQSVSGSRAHDDVVRFSAPEMNGRLTGTSDDLESGRLVADRFGMLGLHPGGTDPLPGGSPAQLWAMAMEVNVGQITSEASLELIVGNGLIPAQLGTDYLPVLDSPSVKIAAPIVFVGYGISDPGRGFDEYASLDVQNRVVLFLRGKPEHYPGVASQEDKVRTARQKGAVAYLTVTGPILSAYETRRGVSGAPMGSFGSPPGSTAAEPSLAGCWIGTPLAEKILRAGDLSLRDLQEQLNRTSAPQSRATKVVARLAWTSTRDAGTLRNILGLIPAAGPPAPSFPDQTVIIGAHRDHLGRHGGTPFPGADDNASGTAILLEVARAVTQSGLRAKRALLFVSFSGEEQGLLGSRLYASRPPRPLAATAAMINVDHAGVGNGRLTVGVSGIEKSVTAEAGRIAGLADRLDLFGYFPGGDHVPFKEAGVPTITVVSSGRHPDFHQPTDTADKVKPEILEVVARYVLAAAWQVANAP
jgi:hypothetical protein